MVVVGANDAQLHAFDTGRFDGSVVDGEVDGVFDNGTGKEIFSVIPRSLLPRTLEAAETTRQDWGVDGSVLVDDFFIDPSHTGIPDPDEREWRSVALTGLREGGRAYLAVDITQPDKIQSSPIAQGFFLPDDGGSSDYVPTCLSAYNASQCGPLAFPSVLWEFTDDELPNEDGVGGKDLGEAWSTPNTGRLRVIEDGEEVDKFVAVVGGGMDPDKQNLTGNWLYIIDVETGKPIYKRELDGSAPSEPAAVDTDQNGYLDTIYIGTTAGFLYKADISVPKEIVEVDVMGTIVRRVTDADWDPVAIFGTGGRPIFFPPAVVYVPHHGRYALAFGAGDREDLWDLDGVEGRFYMILDQDFDASTVGLPLTEGAYTTVTADGGEESGTSFLLNPPVGRRPGWVMLLEADERVITKAFSLSGITVFTSYMPDFNTFTGDPGNGNDPAPVCSKTGESRIFVVYTDSANAVLTLEGQKVRYWLVSEFVTEPFTEQSATKNPPGEDEGSHADQLTDELREVMETLKGLFPSDCRFGNFTMNIKTIRSDTGVVFIAPVPICIIEKNWKEF
jgi:Tfp pilus tip-associated adhesin PilY1